MPIVRKVRYNFKIDTGEQIFQRFRWTVAVLNEPREIERISERFFLQLAPVGEETINYEALIPNSGGIHCKVFSFSSEKGKFLDSSKIYSSKQLRKDRDLWERDEVGLEGYVSRLIK